VSGDIYIMQLSLMSAKSASDRVLLTSQFFCSRNVWRSTRTDIAARNLQFIQQHDRVHGWCSTCTDIA
jgi:hypothetical protein